MTPKTDSHTTDSEITDSPVTDSIDQPKRDFLEILLAGSATVGTGAFMWTLVDSMNPAADVLAVASIEVELDPIEPGQAITVLWRGKPVFIRHRTREEITEAQTQASGLIDPEEDSLRVQRPQWLVVIGVCTHLGCVPLGQKPGEVRGEYNGWFCPCHGSHYDISGRIRKGPAPTNLEVPQYTFLSDSLLRLG